MVTASGTFTNNGVLDLINGPSTLPAYFVNDGTVIDRGSAAVSSNIVGADSVVSVVLSGYAGQTYQLQSTNSLTTPNWQNVGSSQSVPASQTGAASLTFSDDSSVGGPAFYRVIVTVTP